MAAASDVFDIFGSESKEGSRGGRDQKGEVMQLVVGVDVLNGALVQGSSSPAVSPKTAQLRKRLVSTCRSFRLRVFEARFKPFGRWLVHDT